MNPTRIWYLLGRKLAGEASLEEIRELEQLLVDAPEIAAQAEIHNQYFDKRPGNQAPSEEEIQAWQKQLKRMEEVANPETRAPEFRICKTRGHQTHKWLTLQKTILAAAAVIPLTLLSIWLFRPAQLTGKTSSSQKSPITTLQTTTDKIKDTLPDGTTIWLNSNTRLSYKQNFGRNNRDLTLEGEAFFDVVHKAELPMVVHAGPIAIRVLGTAFNVKSYREDNRVEASLLRGAIELTLDADRQHRILLKPNQKITIRIKGDGVSIDSASDNHPAATASGNPGTPPPFTLNTLSVESRSGLIPEVSWIENKLVFNTERLYELTEQMQRWYHVTISIPDTALAKEKFTGVLENETLEEALSALQLTYPFHYKINGAHVIITKNKKEMR